MEKKATDYKNICTIEAECIQFFCYPGSLVASPHFSSAICCEAGKRCVYFVGVSQARLPTLEKHPQHTDSMPAGVFPRAPRIHNPFRLLATNLVRNPG
jgi:hypothetical protein